MNRTDSSLARQRDRVDIDHAVVNQRPDGRGKVEVLLVGTLCLVPGQSARTLGMELLVLGAAAWYAIDRVLRADAERIASSLGGPGGHP